MSQWWHLQTDRREENTAIAGHSGVRVRGTREETRYCTRTYHPFARVAITSLPCPRWPTHIQMHLGSWSRNRIGIPCAQTSWLTLVYVWIPDSEIHAASNHSKVNMQRRRLPSTKLTHRATLLVKTSIQHQKTLYEFIMRTHTVTHGKQLYNNTRIYIDTAI